MKSTSAQRVKAAQLLNRSTVVELILTYRKYRNVTWSSSRVLYRLGISNHHEFPSDLKRKARKILEQLVREGLLRKKPGPALGGGGAYGDVGFLLAVENSDQGMTSKYPPSSKR